MVLQASIFTRRGVDRILKYAFELAQMRPRKRLTSATKSNGLAFSMPYWDERFEVMAAQYPQISADKQHIDILCARFVLNPERLMWLWPLTYLVIFYLTLARRVRGRLALRLQRTSIQSVTSLHCSNRYMARPQTFIKEISLTLLR